MPCMVCWKCPTLIYTLQVLTCMQVARASDPLEDAAVVAAVRAAVGPGVRLRVDANRRWTLQQAIAFGRAAEASGLEVRPARTPQGRLIWHVCVRAQRGNVLPGTSWERKHTSYATCLAWWQYEEEPVRNAGDLHKFTLPWG